MNETIKYQYEENNDVYVVEIQETGAERTVDGITVKETFELFEELTNEWTDKMVEDIELIREMIDIMVSFGIKEYEVKLALIVYGVLPITPKNTFKGDNMIKVLKMSDEEFEELIDEVFFIEYETKLVRDENTKVQYKTTEEVLEAINDLIGILNIKEAKEFIFKYGDRRNEDKELYDELLLEKIEYSDEIVDKEIKIEEIREEDYNDWGIKCGGLLIGYNIQY